VKNENWLIRETAFDPERLHHEETVFTIGNGYLGTRGAFEEGYPGATPATLVHGVWDDAPLFFTELANAPNWLPFVLSVDGERFGLGGGEVLRYERVLDMRAGMLRRQVRWRSPAGREVDVSIERFASLADEHVLAIRYGVTPLDGSAGIELRAGLDACTDNWGLRHVEWLAQGSPGPQRLWLRSRTLETHIELAYAAHLAVDDVSGIEYRSWDTDGRPASVARFTLGQGQTATAAKLITLYTGRDTGDPLVAAQAKLEQAIEAGYTRLRQVHVAAWAGEWAQCNVTVEGDDVADRALRYSLFQLLIAAPRHDDRVSIGAKTLSGFGYRGHTFWDTETFILPFFTYTRPEIARNLLLYRYHTLPGARQNAAAEGYEGACYAWESAETGVETTPKWWPLPDGSLVRIWSGDIELHIISDIAYAVDQYWRVTGDDDFVRDYGAEIILDTAVFWGSRVEYDDEADQYEVTDVIGPDEWHEHVNNNVYTNRMIQYHLGLAFAVLEWLDEHAPEKGAELRQRLDLSHERLARWRDVEAKIKVNYDPATGLMEQFDGYFDLQDVDMAGYEPRTQPMYTLLRERGVDPNDTQLLKQPDVIVLLCLLPDAYDDRTRRANWDYYAPRTDHRYGSSLGSTFHAILACRLGKPEVAYEHLMRAAGADLEDSRGNAGEGIHGASCGGMWQAAVLGFAGLRVTPEGYHVASHLPKHWKRLRFTFWHRGQPVEVVVENETEGLAAGGKGRTG